MNMNKEPKNIKIGFNNYDIVRSSGIYEYPDELMGRISYSDEKIEIATKYTQDQRNATFLHEMFHAIFNKLDMENERDDEKLVNQLATELYLIIQNNPHIFKMANI